MMKTRTFLFLSVLMVVTLALAACGRAPAGEVPGAPGEAPPGAEETPAEETPAEEGVPVMVSLAELTEFAIDMPASLPAGPTTFEVTNDGTIEHNFEIEGEGIEEVFETNLQPGETRTMEVDLAPGTYKVYCPVEGHEEQGMVTELTVTE